MLVSDFDYALPPELIAQAPPKERGHSRMLVLDRQAGAFTHRTVGELPTILDPSDVVVLNNSRVFRARLLGRRVPSGGAVEFLLLGRLDASRWDALVHPGQKLRVGARCEFGGADVRIGAEILERRFYGRRTVRLWADEGRSLEAAIDAIGHVPLPPYVRRPDDSLDRERYQTVYASVRGSVAAPTAGLHLDEALLAALRRRCAVVQITLHVGFGTFKPVRVERVEDHLVDPEVFEIGPEAAETITSAFDEGRRIVAVGTTTTRALESAWRIGRGHLGSGVSRTDLFIRPGVPFSLVGALFTNFHLPRSSLLMLVCAFAGRERVLAAYREAIEQRYRFYSYGDAMLIL